MPERDARPTVCGGQPAQHGETRALRGNGLRGLGPGFTLRGDIILE